MIATCQHLTCCYASRKIHLLQTSVKELLCRVRPSDHCCSLERVTWLMNPPPRHWRRNLKCHSDSSPRCASPPRRLTWNMCKCQKRRQTCVTAKSCHFEQDFGSLVWKRNFIIHCIADVEINMDSWEKWSFPAAVACQEESAWATNQKHWRKKQ